MEDALHPIQGLPPEGRLELQPSTQLPVMAFGSLASRSIGDIDDVVAVRDVREDTMLRATACCVGFCGRAACFGDSTTTPGSDVVALSDGVEGCDIAVPARPHCSSAETDRMAIVRLATGSDANFIVNVLQMRGWPSPSTSPRYHVPCEFELLLVSSDPVLVSKSSGTLQACKPGLPHCNRIAGDAFRVLG